jgi:hypothetical protein
MKDIKNIDRLFQEKFRDFEQHPPPNLWNNINDQLSEKPKKNKGVIWLWFAGIAAGLVILLTLNNPFSTKITPDTKTPVIHTTDVETQTTIKPTQTQTEVVGTENNTNISKQKEAYNTTITLSNPSTQKSYSNTKQINNHSLPSIKPTIDKEIIVANDVVKESQMTTNTSIAETNKQKAKIDENIIDKKQPSIKEQNNEEEAIANNEVDKKSLNEITKDLDITDNQEVKTDKWTLTTMAAPVLFNSFNTNASSIDSRFDNNVHQGQYSTAYGVQLAYQVDEHLSVQTGFHKVNYAYKTEQIYVPLNSIAERSEVNLNSVINMRDFKAPPNQFGVTTNEIESGNLMQVFGYFEVPLEVKYKIIDGLVDLNLLGGFSTLIKNKDEIYYQIDKFSEKINADSDLNSVNLTGNIGVELDYQISSKMYINVTPSFKVHANTFNKSTNGFSPYAVGVYSGLNYRF